MAEESYSFAQARLRLEEIVSQVRKKDVSLEKSLDLLEEGVRLANQCTELIDHADWEAAGSPTPEAGHASGSQGDEVDERSEMTSAVGPGENSPEADAPEETAAL